jgi:ABC-type transport system involved in multi-copper enzyme maturation permease subunit
MSKAITDKPEERPLPSSRPLGHEIAPSVVSDDDLNVPRAVGMIGAMVAIVGGMALAFHLSGTNARLPLGAAILTVMIGLGGVLYHAAFERDIQLRRLYMVVGISFLATAFILLAIPYVRKSGASLALRGAFPFFFLALFFLLAFLRQETDKPYRDVVQFVLGGAGALLAILGLFAGNLSSDFFLPVGLLLAFLGLLFLIAFVSARGISDDVAYYTALGLGAAGALVVLVAIIRSVTPGALVAGYFKAFGFLFILLGLTYLVASVLLWSDSPVVVLTRRELSAFFYSPIAYLTLFGFALVCWISYYFFLADLQRAGPPVEPIVRSYLFNLFPVFVGVFAVPVLTMRLLSEEQASGTIEVLLTAPVEDLSVVLSKFFAALITFLIVWSPFYLLLAAIPLSGGAIFDYRPLISFTLCLIISGAAFVSMGLFFSSLTRSQIGSGVLTFAGMLLLTFTYFAGFLAGPESEWKTIFQHLSYLDLWLNSLEGKLTLRSLLPHLSMTVLFLFLTVQVLGSRKWR